MGGTSEIKIVPRKSTERGKVYAGSAYGAMSDAGWGAASVYG